MRSYTIDQWCELHSVSRAYFYKLQKLGTGPETFTTGKLVRISEAANHAWIERGTGQKPAQPSHWSDTAVSA